MSEWKKARKKPIVIEYKRIDKPMNIETLEGTMRAKKGDYLIRGIKGELYPCDSEIFRRSYEIFEEEEPKTEIVFMNRIQKFMKKLQDDFDLGEHLNGEVRRIELLCHNYIELKKMETERGENDH